MTALDWNRPFEPCEVKDRPNEQLEELREAEGIMEQHRTHLIGVAQSWGMWGALAEAIRIGMKHGRTEQ